jgi:hypothetical protein
MSGGSLDYVYGRVDDAAQSIMQQSKNPLYAAFAKHLIKVAKALHDLEWVLSGDCSEPSEVAAIRAVISPTEELDSVREEAEVAFKNLEQAIKNSLQV